MSGLTSATRKPAATGNLIAAVGMATAVVAAAAALAWGSANFGRASQVAAPAAPLAAPAVRDTDRYNPAPATIDFNGPVGNLTPKSFSVPQVQGVGGFPGNSSLIAKNAAGGVAGNPDRVKDDISTGSSKGSPALRRPGLLAQ